MCKHTWKTVNDLRVCPRCGLTIRLLDGKVMYDKTLPGLLGKKRKGGK